MRDEALPASPDEPAAAGVEAVRRLVASVPEMEAVLTAHLADNDTVLPYVLITDLARCYVAAVSDGRTDTVRRLVGALEFLGASPRQDVRGLLLEFISGLVAGAGPR